MAEEKISLKKNFVMNMILTMSSFVFPLITFPYVSRVLGPTGTGKVSLANSWVTYFNLFAQLGIPTYGIRACAQVRDNREELTRTTQELLIINIVMGIISYGLFFIMVFLNPKMQSEKMLYIIMSSLILFNAIGMEWLYKGLEQYTYITKRSIVFKFIALVGMFLLVRSKSDYVAYGGLTIFASSASNVMNFFHAHRYIGMKPVGGYHFKRHLKAVGIFFAMSCATTIYTNLDVVMLGHMTGDKDVGYYNAAVRIKSILVSIVTSLGGVLLPRASYYVEHGEMDEFRRITRKALDFVCIFAIPLALYFMLFAQEGILLLSGRQYYGSIQPMQIIMPTVIFIGITNILGIQVLVPLGREKIVLYSEIAGAVVDFAINWALIPKFHASGAAFGTLVAEIVVLIVQYQALKDNVRDSFRRISFGWIFIALAAATAGSLWLKAVPFAGIPFTLRQFVVLLISAVIFFGVYAAVLLWRKEPMAVEIVNTGLSKLRRKKA